MRNITIIFCSVLLMSCTNREKIKEEIKEDILNEIQDRKKAIKGNGTNFYGEKISIDGEIHYLHHSSLNCPAIHSGIQRNWYNQFENRNTFCNICMDDYLITKFNEKFFSDK